MPTLKDKAADFEAALQVLEAKKLRDPEIILQRRAYKIKRVRDFLAAHENDELNEDIVTQLADFLKTDSRPSLAIKLSMFFKKSNPSEENTTAIFNNLIQLVNNAIQESAHQKEIKIDPSSDSTELGVNKEMLDTTVKSISATVSLAQGEIRAAFNNLENNMGLLASAVATALKSAPEKLAISQQQRGRSASYYENSALGKLFADSGEVSIAGAASRDDFATAIVDQYRSRLGGEALKKFQALEAIDASFVLVIPNLQKIQAVTNGTGDYAVWDADDKQALIIATITQITVQLDTAQSLLQSTLPKDMVPKIQAAIEKINGAMTEITAPK